MTWLALTVLSCVVIVRATSVVQQRAHLQEAADAIALGAVQHSTESLRHLAQLNGVELISVSRTDSQVRVEVSSSYGTAVSTASGM